MTSEFKVGDRVEIERCGEWLAATVTKVSAFYVSADFDHRHPLGGLRTIVEHDQVRRIITTPPPRNDLACPRCGAEMRKRGEVRVWTGLCGCAIAPAVESVVLKAFADSDPPMVERGWRAAGYGATAVHPTEAGAIAAWRTALERVQREQDEHPLFVMELSEEMVEDAMRAVAKSWRAVLRPCEDALDGLADRVTAFGTAIADSVPHPTLPGQHVVEIAIGTPPRAGKFDRARALLAESADRMVFAAIPDSTDPPPALMRAARVTMEGRLFENERAAIATLPTRTDAEVRTLVAALTERTHVETIVAVANECARRWPGRTIDATLAGPGVHASRFEQRDGVIYGVVRPDVHREVLWDEMVAIVRTAARVA